MAHGLAVKCGFGILFTVTRKESTKKNKSHLFSGGSERLLDVVDQSHIGNVLERSPAPIPTVLDSASGMIINKISQGLILQ